MIGIICGRREPRKVISKGRIRYTTFLYTSIKVLKSVDSLDGQPALVIIVMLSYFS